MAKSAMRRIACAWPKHQYIVDWAQRERGRPAIFAQRAQTSPLRAPKCALKTSSVCSGEFPIKHRSFNLQTLYTTLYLYCTHIYDVHWRRIKRAGPEGSLICLVVAIARAIDPLVNSTLTGFVCRLLLLLLLCSAPWEKGRITHCNWRTIMLE